MPKVKTKSGKTKHYSYTPKGMKAAKSAAKKAGTKVQTKRRY
jgi:hypothetical protein|tara:strand:+ start:71 stop:196 length:126 start_codon:yes stop_codon:yes gene_type:complete